MLLPMKMADTMRISSSLPTIKCSTCHVEIDISAMGDHICSKAVNTSPENISWIASPIKGGSKLGSAINSALPRHARLPSTRTDLHAANHSFPYHGGPNNGAGCKFSGNGASTLPRHQPNPSIERSNLDCAFPPFPLTQPSRGASTDQHNKIAKSRTPTNLTFPEPSPLYSPLSPGTHGGENVLQRMNGIAPGPFAIRDRQSSDRPRPSTAASTTGLELPGTSHGGSSGQYRPATDGRSDESTSLPQWSASPNTMTTFDGARPSRPSQSRTDRLHGPGSAGRSITDPSDGHSSGTGFGHDRGKELPSKQNSLSNDSRPPIFADQRPTRPFRGLRPSSPIGPEGEAFNPRKPSDAVGLQSQNLTATPQTHARHTTFPRATLPKEDAKHDHQPKPIQTHETLPRAEEYAIGNPYHTSTPSQSSSGSGWGSDTRTRSSRSSPPASGSPDRLQRKWGGGESNAKSARVTKWPSQTELADRAPALQPPESPLDPAIKGGMFLKNPRHGPQSVTAAPESPVVSPRRPTKASRGDCRGCGEAIRGKSVSSADGRLTGRYHKQCFVCKACQQPFDSATFYVLDNHPYCERDYHKLNNSLCQACDRGIEGQYLETERRQKYHPDCLTCQDCRKILRTDYFEMHGKVYCEQHAFRLAKEAALLGPGRRNPERRTTRLMMMG